MNRATGISFASGLLLSGLVAFAAISPEPESTQTASSGKANKSRLPERAGIGPLEIDLQKEGPFLGGIRLSFEEAESRTAYDLPRPPETETTGRITGIWSEGQDIAIVWDSGMRFYVTPTTQTETQAVERWTTKIAEEPDVWSITTVRGRPALSVEGDGKNPSSISFLERGLYLQFISPSHTVSQLQSLAEGVTF